MYKAKKLRSLKNTKILIRNHERSDIENIFLRLLHVNTPCIYPMYIQVVTSLNLLPKSRVCCNFWLIFWIFWYTIKRRASPCRMSITAGGIVFPHLNDWLAYLYTRADYLPCGLAVKVLYALQSCLSRKGITQNNLA